MEKKAKTDTLEKLPVSVKKGLIKFLKEIPVEEFSEEWRAVQVAIAMITAPGSFKDRVHVFLSSHDGGSEEGYYDHHRMTVRIWPDKLQMCRTHKIWSSWNGTQLDETFRYTFPGGKHGVYEFEDLLSDTAGLFSGRYCIEDLSMGQRSGSSANFSITTNAK